MRLTNTFLPVNKEDLAARNIDRLDFIVVSGDGYVDHPSFGAAIIGRVLEAQDLPLESLPNQIGGA